MKFKSKRLIAIVLGAVMLLSVFAGCATGSNNTTVTTKAPDNQSTTGTQTEATEPAEPVDPLGKYEEPVTLTCAMVSDTTTHYIPGNPDYDSAEKNLWISAYKDYLNIDVTMDWVSADSESYVTKWNLAMAQGTLPDFGYVNAATYKMLVEADLVYDMTDIVEEYASDLYKEFLDADGGISRAYSTYDGRLLGVPRTGKTPDNVSVFYVRQDWLDKLNLEVPKTIDDLIEVAQAFVDNKMGGEGTYGIPLNKGLSDSNEGAMGFFEGYGACLRRWIEDENGNLVYSSVQDNVKAPLLKLQEMYAKGLINTDFAVSGSNVTGEDVAAGKVGMLYGTYYAATGADTLYKNDPDAKWTIVEIPTVDGSAPIVHGDASIDQFLFVNKDCEHPEAVMKMVNLTMWLQNNEDPEIVLRYSTHTSPADPDQKIETHKYIPWSGVSFSLPWTNLTRHLEATKAMETGKEEFTLASSKTTYDSLIAYLDGDVSQSFNWLTFGPEGTFAVINKYIEEGRNLINAYQTTKTQTMLDKQGILDDALEGAMMKVIMGEDISVYEAAVQEWYKNGGQTMTDEANAWYATTK